DHVFRGRSEEAEKSREVGLEPDLVLIPHSRKHVKNSRRPERYNPLRDARGSEGTMGYQVLARKYRPQRFADVAGQDHVTRTLLNALTQNRIAHGYIFSGHRGIGKTTIARILAKALNCSTPVGSPERPTEEPCRICV